jgi:hypothetical protein
MMAINLSVNDFLEGNHSARQSKSMGVAPGAEDGAGKVGTRK